MRTASLWRVSDPDTADEPEKFFPRPNLGRERRTPASSTRKKVRRLLQGSDWVLAVFGILFLVAYAVPILRPSMPHAWRTLCSWVQYIAWAVFALDYVARLWAARDRKRYFTRHVVDLIIVVAPAFSPALRALRLLRLVVLFRVLNRRFASALQGRVALYVSLSAGILVFTAALAVLDAERGQPGAKINSFGNAIWWAMTTVTTVGYGDYFPVTTTGRFIAVGLMIGGVALIGVVTASFAAWFIDRVRVEEEEQAAATQRDLHAIAERLDVVTAELIELRRAANRAERTERERRELSSP